MSVDTTITIVVVLSIVNLVFAIGRFARGSEYTTTQVERLEKKQEEHLRSFEAKLDQAIRDFEDGLRDLKEETEKDHEKLHKKANDTTSLWFTLEGNIARMYVSRELFNEFKHRLDQLERRYNAQHNGKAH